MSDDLKKMDPHATQVQEPGTDAAIAPAWAPSIGAVLGGYVLLEKIGQGGMGVVFKARQEKLDRLAAIKVIRAGDDATRYDTDLFRAEARTAAQVRHPNIIGVYETGQSCGWHYIAMELVEGTGLDQRLARGPLAVEEIARLIIKIARAVDYLHQAGIVHCDLKPANILLDREGEPYVTDFGLARILAGTYNVLSDGTIAGTPHYMSPEQASGRLTDTAAASDIYSLGAILYHMITGRPPFDSESPSDLLAFVVGRSPPLPRSIRRDIPRSVESICFRCLEKAPQDRYASAADLAEDLEHFLCGEPLAGPRIGPSSRLVKWAIRQPALATRIVAAALLYGIEQVWFHVMGITTLRFYLTVSLLVPSWIAACWMLQRMEHHPQFRRGVGALWGVADVAVLTAILLASAQGVYSPAAFCYFLVLCASGLWYRQWLVWLSTVSVMGSYGIVWAATKWTQPEIIGPFDRHVMFLASLLLLGTAVSRMVHHIQILSRRLSLH